MTRYFLARLASVSTAALCAVPIHAQTTQQQSAAADPTEIVVTANKREENLNRVGLSVTALSQSTIAERGITSLQAVAAAVPGLSFSQSANNTPILTLRGIGFNESSLGSYPAVSVYVDQAPLPFPVLASHSAFDLQRIEVLKGPQGTLFGQNSTGGAINYIAARPTDHFAAGGDIGYGRFNEVSGDAYVSGPLAPGLRARIAITGKNADGWQISNSRPEDRNGKQSYIAGRLLLDWDPAETVHLSFSLNGWHDRSQPEAAQFILLQPQTADTVRPEELTEPLSPQKPRAADWATGVNTPRSDRNFVQPALRADIDLTDAIRLTSLTSYGQYKQDQTTDGDGSALLVTDLAQDHGYIHTFNQELRLANDAASAFRWVLGGNIERSTTFERQIVSFANNSGDTPSRNSIFQNGQQAHQSIRNYAFFANGEYDVTRALTLKGAVRYTNSRNNAKICGFDAGDGQIAGLFNSLGQLLGTVPFTPIGTSGPVYNRCFSLNANGVPGTPFIGSLKEDNVSWRAGIDYRLGSATLLYANVSRGYKAGSFPILAAATISQFNPVTQEKVTAYEGGLKTSFWDKRAQFNGSVFYYDYRDKQVLTKVADPIFGILDKLQNVPKSRVLGLEGELTVRPAHGLTFNASTTYLDSKIQKYQGVDYVGTSRNFAGSPLPFAPKWNYSINLDYRYEMANGGAPFVGVSANGHSSSVTVPGGDDIGVTPSATTRVALGVSRPFMTNGYATVDARLGYAAAGGRWEAFLWGKNIFNKYYWTNVVTASDFTARYAGMPATYGVTVRFKID
jgi:outer membrane receptor protein involved in Fe transport